MAQIFRAIALDCLRFVGGTKLKWAWPAELVLSPILVAMTNLLAKGSDVGDGLLGVVIGLLVVTMIIVPYIFAMVDTGADGGRLVGIVPVSRANQVNGRYIFVIFTNLLSVADGVLCIVLDMLIHAVRFDSDLVQLIGVVALAIFALVVLFNVILLPATYRFHTKTALFVVYLVTFTAIYALLFVAARMQAALTRSLARFIVYVLVGPWIDALMGVAVIAVAISVSLLISQRIVRRREF